MPIQSKSQLRALFAKNPAVAKEFVSKTKKPLSALPERKGRARKTKASNSKKGSRS